VGRDDRELAEAVRGTKAQIAFYASTSAYRGVLELHGWGGLQPKLTRLSREGKWAEMGECIDDEILHAMAVVGDPQQVARGLWERWGDVAQRISFYATYTSDPAVWTELLAAIRAAQQPAR
jgi:alkanesulfonate monooxygenase SsuD/methylene tetrahydromethanopterin reductase-like flavin-dependent oxidoreductase (luciferase family)